MRTNTMVRSAQRVEACISEVMERFENDSKAYYVEVHQHLAPLARQLERECDGLRAEVELLRSELAAGAARPGGNTSDNSSVAAPALADAPLTPHAADIEQMLDEVESATAQPAEQTTKEQTK